MSYYNLLADAVMVIHWTFIVSVFLGILLSIKYKKFRPIESLVLLSAVIIWSLYGGCPLTNLESYLRDLSSNPLPINEIGFIPYYLSTWFNISLTNFQVEILTYGICLLFVIISFEWIGKYLHKPLRVKIKRN
ncbi:MAG: DUF2784 family protein [Patescibacteria group bacterium]